MTRTIHLLCHAHLDPVWLWTFEDGLAETLSTFRVAADFCERHDGFVFNQNESLLYGWVRDHDPALHGRIGALVEAGRWHVAGGAFLQPDLNAPGGESLIRQFLIGLRDFKEAFGERPRTAYNLDSFGHPEGFPQLLRGAGFDSYLFARPDYGTWPLPRGNFIWTDRSGAQITARRADEGYVSHPGDEKLDLDVKVPRALDHYADEADTLLLWGVGNHGGGASRIEYEQLKRLATQRPELTFVHSTPERFFAATRGHASMPTVAGEIQHSFPGCYSSMSRVKRKHRQTEGMLAQVERLGALAWWSGVAPYPAEGLASAWRDTLFCQFHDVITGTGTPGVEREALDRLGRAQLALREAVSRVWTRLDQRDGLAADDAVAIRVFNPHGHRVRTLVPLDYTVAKSWVTCGAVVIRHRGRKLRIQRVASGNNLDTLWTPRVLVAADLQPFETQSWTASVDRAAASVPNPPASRSGAALVLSTRHGDVAINSRTGLIDHITDADGEMYWVGRGAFRPVLFDDFDHSWACGDARRLRDAPDLPDAEHCGFRGMPWTKPTQRFRLATAAETFAIAGRAANDGGSTMPTSPPVRVAEDGPLRRVVEAVFVAGRSSVLRRYVLDRRHGRLYLHDHVHFQQRDQMLKLELPLGFRAERSASESLFSAAAHEPTPKVEDRPNQRWVAVSGPDRRFLAVVNDGSFGHALTDKALYLNLLRSPPYASFGVKSGDPYHAHEARPRQDQGEHDFRFELCWGRRLDEGDLRRRADELQLAPMTHVAYGRGTADDDSSAWPALRVTPAAVQIVALKRADDGDGLVVRLLNPAPRTVRAAVWLDRDAAWEGSIAGRALRTLRLRRTGRRVGAEATNLVEGL